MQLPCRFTYNAEETLQAVREGKVAIALMGETSIFTTEQHFIAITGMGEYGKFTVNDPLEANYTGSRHMKESFATGFSHIDLKAGFSGGWIFDRNAMPPEPFLFDAAMPEQQSNRYEGYTLTEEDIYTLACFVRVEAREEESQVKQAVAEVVLNRIMSEDYPNTVRDVIWKTEFYRSVEAMSRVQEPELDCYLAVDAAMYGPYVLPENVVHFATYRVNDNVWGQIGGHIFCYG